MTLAFDLRDIANSTAKKFDHGEVTTLHVLFALKRLLPKELSSVDVLAIERELAKLPRAPAKALATSQEVEDLLVQVDSIPRALEIAKSLGKSLLGIELHIEAGMKVAGVSEEVYEKPKLEDSLSKLNSLIGLSEVKSQVHKLISVHQANQVRFDQGLKRIPIGLHCVFTGSPGTGKTTVARCVAEMYHAIGLLPTSKVVETDRSSLVAGYIGQTALKVQEAIQSAMGGVLFIDEAYALTSDSGAGFGDEAVATLVKAMEDHRDSLAVIVAGYKEPMKQFVESNQGLKSRFQTFIDFPDYSAEDLALIFAGLCQSHEMKFNNQVQEKLLDYIKKSRPQGERGNARFIRNLFEKMYLALSHRAASDGKIEIHEVTEFSELDIPEVEPTPSKIGFAP